MDNRNHLFFYLVLFLISPVLAAISAMANFHNRNARVTLILFVAAFGFTMFNRPGTDGHSQVMNFLGYYQFLSFDEFKILIIDIATLQGGKHLHSGAGADELYLPFLSYTLAQFTANPSILFLIAGLIYGYFFINGISLVYSDMHRNWNIALLILFLFFISWKNLEGLNSIRNWTGAWCFFNGAYLYLKTENKKYFLLVMLAPFFHFGYLVITVPFYLYVIFKDQKIIYVSLLLISFVFTAGLDVLEPILSSTPLGEDKVRAYTTDRFYEESTGSRSFHAQYYRTASDFIIQLLFIHAILFLGYLKEGVHDRFQDSLGSIAILLLIFSNLAFSIPVLRNRIFVNFGLFALAYLVLLYSKLDISSNSNKILTYICVPGILLFMFTQYSQVGDFMDFRVLFSPLFYSFIGDDPVSMKEFIRSLIL